MKKNTSWESSSSWYHDYMKEEGGYFHKELIIPKLIEVLDLKPSDRLIDCGCGQGILARSLPKIKSYLGLDASKSLIKHAREQEKKKRFDFIVHDMMKPISCTEKFTHSVFLLSVQNMAKPDLAIENISKVLTSDGRLLLVINHPCFRIPKYSSWDFSSDRQRQSRRIERYFSPHRSILKTNPSKKGKSATTISYHWPLSYYTDVLSSNGFVLENIHEICSRKKSYGKNARAENFARKEFPVFMLLCARRMQKR